MTQISPTSPGPSLAPVAVSRTMASLPAVRAPRQPLVTSQVQDTLPVCTRVTCHVLHVTCHVSTHLRAAVILEHHLQLGEESVELGDCPGGDSCEDGQDTVIILPAGHHPPGRHHTEHAAQVQVLVVSRVLAEDWSRKYLLSHPAYQTGHGLDVVGPRHVEGGLVVRDHLQDPLR